MAKAFLSGLSQNQHSGHQGVALIANEGARILRAGKNVVKLKFANRAYWRNVLRGELLLAVVKTNARNFCDPHLPLLSFFLIN